MKTACSFNGPELSDIEGTWIIATSIDYVVKSGRDFPKGEPSIPDTTLFFPFLLRETAISEAWKISDNNGFAEHDFAFNHVVNVGLTWLYEDWKDGKIKDISDLVKKTDQVKMGRYSGGAYTPEWSPHAQTKTPQ